MINWINIEDNKFPGNEVIATNGFNDYLVGYLHYDYFEKEIICESEETLLNGITHYSELNSPKNE